MCTRCDGYGFDDHKQKIDLTVRVHGFAIQQVAAEGRRPSWAYSVGLGESFDLPDLLCVDIEDETQASLISDIGSRVRSLGSYDESYLDHRDVELIPVHPSHLRGGLVAVWSDRYDRLPRAGEFLQVVPGPSWFCDCHAHSMRRLDSPKRRRRRAA
ncbi:MAG: DUF4262 domain-containing protein [Actinomycetia bacterium]|nr:DUF4262 domain-containing protein [Actinomycetes bacterium]MCP4961653.1 DUF4262 domain-containing protein [Actinomycetes bacterium]